MLSNLEDTVTSAEDPQEALLRSLDYSGSGTSAEQAIELYLIARAYAGGRALHLGGSAGHLTLALALAGLVVVCHRADDQEDAPSAALLERHGQTVQWQHGDVLRLLDGPGELAIILLDAGVTEVSTFLKLFWTLNLQAGGTLALRDPDTNEQDRLGTFGSAQALTTTDNVGRRTIYLLKASGSCGAGRDREDWTAVESQQVARLQYLLRGMHSVDGWLSNTAAHAIDQLLATQRTIGVRGNMLEIGVYHGKLLILMALGLAPEEEVLGVDFSFTEPSGEPGSPAEGKREKCEENLARHAPLANVRLLRADSTLLGPEFRHSETGKRFISIDGGHDRGTVANDLWIAQDVIGEGGIIAADDFYEIWWSGVTAGVARYYHSGGTLVPFAIGGRKLFLTTSPVWASRYQEALEEMLRTVYEHRQQVFEFDDVLIFWEDPRFDSDA